MKANLKRGVLIVVVLLVSLNFVYAADTFNHVISNSEDWRDVYSSIIYANIKGVDNTFLVSTLDGSIALNSIGKDSKIMVVSSRKNPYVFNYPDLIKSKGFTSVQETLVNSANTELINDLPDVNTYIVVGDSYGFNAMAVAPYADITKSWVFFGNKYDIYTIDSILAKRKVSKLIVYGFVDREVTDTLAKYNPETINTGDKFKDNVEIVKKYIAIKPVKQVALSNGEFVEKELMQGLEPILFTGTENVPTQISDYIKTSNIEIGVLIGNELVGAATNIRRTTGMNVMVKFARGARTQTSGVAEVEGLDIFPLPTPTLNLTIYSLVYNRATSELAVTYKSDSNAPLYLKGTITLNSGDGSSARVGDINPVFVAPGAYKTIVYSTSISSSENLTADLSTLFGETSSALDRILRGTLTVTSINIIDKCKLTKENILGISYNKQNREFIIKIKNPSDVSCWYDLELNDIVVGYARNTLSPESSIMILPGKTGSIIVKQDLTASDLEKNSMIDMNVYSGEKQDNLVNSLMHIRLNLTIESFSAITFIAIGLAILIIVLVIFIIILIRRRKDKDDDI